MRDKLIHIGWTAAPLSPEQLTVLHRIAVLFLRREDPSQSSINFSHELIEGRLTRKGKGLFVTFAGTFFHADLGTVRGERWTVDFLLPAGMENVVLDASNLYTSRARPDGTRELLDVDIKLTAASEASLLG